MAIVDKGVGELWLWVNSVEPDPTDEHTLSAEEGQELIRKLVEERQRMYYTQKHGLAPVMSQKDWLECGVRARVDFGIPEEGWYGRR